jgi:hypothetical protein
VADRVLIYVQGTHRIGVGPSVDRLAAGLSAALGPDFHTDGRIESHVVDDVAIATRTIFRREADGRHRPWLRIVEADYYDLFRAWDEVWLPQRLLRMLQLVVPNLSLLGRVPPFWKDDRGKLQTAYIVALAVANIIAPLLAVAILFLIANSALGSVKDLAPGVQFAGSLAVLLSLLALIKVFWEQILPKRPREIIGLMARDPVRMLEYFSTDPAPKSFAARLIRRLETADRFVRRTYPEAKVYVAGYSFGAILAYDWLFPRARWPWASRRTSIDGLVTLGFPFRMVTTFWPRYFDDRPAAVMTPLPFAAYLNSTLQSDLAGSTIPADSALHKALSAATGTVLFEEHDDPEPAGLYERSRLTAINGVYAHAAYFGFGDPDKALALKHCATFIKRTSSG